MEECLGAGERSNSRAHGYPKTLFLFRELGAINLKQRFWQNAQVKNKTRGQTLNHT